MIKYYISAIICLLIILINVLFVLWNIHHRLEQLENSQDSITIGLNNVYEGLVEEINNIEIIIEYEN